MSPSTLAGDELTQFKKLVENDGNYVIRVKSPSGGSITAFVRACALAASTFREDWEVTMDQFGNIIAINYTPKTQACPGPHIAQGLQTAQFQTSVKLAYPWRGIRPEVKAGQAPGAVPGATAQPENDAAAQGSSSDSDEPQEEQSFLRKYWLYIAIPVVFLMMNGMPPEEGANTQGRSGQRNPAPRRRPAGST
jgi:hypothetical protein